MAFGLRPVRHRNGAPYNGAVSRYLIPSTDSNDYFIGDPVRLAGTGNTEGTIATVKIAVVTTNTVVLGPIVAFEFDPDDLTAVYGKASTDRIVYVADDPDLVFEVTEDAGGAAIVVGDIGDRFIMTAGSGGSTATGLSSWELDSSSAAGAATHQYTLLGLREDPGNELGSGTTSSATFFVTIENDMHQFGSLATPVATPA